MICTQCGQTISDDARFCGFCGAQQKADVSAAPAAAAGAGPPPPVPKPPAVRSTSTISAKTILMIVLIGALVLGGFAITLWLYFFPPGVYVRDSFRKAHKEIEAQMTKLGAKIEGGMLVISPPNEKFYSILYDKPASDQATVEVTTIWKEGDDKSLFGLICCAAGEDDFTVFMLGGNSDYLLNQHTGEEWYDLTGFLRLPKSMKIEKNVPYKLKIVTEKDYISIFLNDTLLLKLVDAFDHRGRVGLYAQGGKTGKTVIAFDDLKAKKNSLFQDDNEKAKK